MQPADAALEHIAHSKLAADLLRIERPVAIRESSIARDDKHAREPRQIGRQILGDAVREILLVGIIAEIGERQLDDRKAWHDGGLGDWRSGRDARCRRIGDGFGAQRIDPHRSSNVLDALLAPILERINEPVADLVAHHPRDADPAGLCERFQARRDIDAVTEDVAAVDDDVTEIDPDPEPDPAVLGHTGLAIDRRAAALRRSERRQRRSRIPPAVRRRSF